MCYSAPIQWFEKESRDIQKKSYGISRIIYNSPINLIFVLRMKLLFRVKERALARTTFTGKFSFMGLDVLSTIN